MRVRMNELRRGAQGGEGRRQVLMRHVALSWLPTRPTWPDILVFAASAAVILVGAVGVVTSRNPVHAALSLVMTLFGVAVAVHRAGGRLPGRGADHRLRRRHRRAVPVRDHVPRRRPARGRRRRNPYRASGPWPSSWWGSPWPASSPCWPPRTGSPGPTRWSGPSRARSPRPRGHRRARWPSSASSCSPPTSSPSRPPPPCWSSPWWVPWCWPGARRSRSRTSWPPRLRLADQQSRARPIRGLSP